MTATTNPIPDLPSASEIRLSRHSVERFQERFRPCFDHKNAKEELRRFLQIAEIQARRPDWVKPHPECEAVAWAVGQDFAIPLVPDRWDHGVITAKTTIARGGITHAERDRRRRRKLTAKQRRRRP